MKTVLQNAVKGEDRDRSDNCGVLNTKEKTRKEGKVKTDPTSADGLRSVASSLMKAK